MDLNLELIELGKKHDMLVSRADVATVMTPGQWSRRLNEGSWRELAPGVWCHVATPVDWRLQARAGSRSLGRQAALHGRTAAAWWSLGGVEPDDPEFVVPRSRSARTSPYVLHTSRHWDSVDLLTHDGVRVTSAARTIVDLAIGGVSAGEIEKVIDAAMHQKRTSLPRLRKRIEALCGRGVRGSTLLKALLLDSGGESFLERRFLELIRSAGLPKPTCQVIHRAGGQRIARVDFQFPGTKVIVEVSGRLGHVSDRDRQRDAHRRNALQQTGHIVLEFTTADVLDGQTYVVATVDEQLKRS